MTAKNIEAFKSFYETTMDSPLPEFAQTVGYGVANNFLAYSIALTMTMKKIECNKDYAKGCIDSWKAIYGGNDEELIEGIQNEKRN